MTAKGNNLTAPRVWFRLPSSQGCRLYIDLEFDPEVAIDRLPGMSDTEKQHTPMMQH